MKTEIILHFVITQHMLLKAGIYMIFSELSYWWVFSFHTRPQCYLVVGSLGWLNCCLHLSWLSATGVSKRCFGCISTTQMLLFFLPGLPQNTCKLKWKCLMENECANGPSSVSFIIFFFPCSCKVGQNCSYSQRIFWFLHDIFCAHYRGKKGCSLVWMNKIAANGGFSWQHTFFGSPSIYKYPGIRSFAGRWWKAL